MKFEKSISVFSIVNSHAAYFLELLEGYFLDLIVFMIILFFTILQSLFFADMT